MTDEFLLIHHIQEFFGPNALPIFWFCNLLWGLDIATRLPAIIFWLGGRTLGFRAALFAAITGPITIYSKWLIQEPRPFYVSDAFAPLKVSTGFGMPSGNALGIAALMFTIAWYARRKWVWGVAAIMIVLFGLARVYYGVHSPTQVVWGWLLGVAIAFALIKSAEPFIRWLQRHSNAYQVLFFLILASIVTVTGVTIDHLVLQSFETPAAWVERYNELATAFEEEDPFSLFDRYDSWVFGGYLFGFAIAGMLLLRGKAPETGTTLGKVLNVGLGIGLYFGYVAIYRAMIGPVYDTWLFEPFILVAFAVFPLLYFVVTPLLTARILATISNARDKAASNT
ncbi:MAG: phosphatase PAP2 family protein [Woeseiaceae bacterium]|nr:phosphatase PAP2 family protein [Woeseiaceae bacterium]